jgi:hypothetical protein
MLRFKGFTFSWGSPLLGVHVGRNPVSGQGFVHVAYFPFCGLDFNFGPELNDEAREVVEASRSRTGTREGSEKG